MTDSELLDLQHQALADVVDLLGEMTLAATKNQVGVVAHCSTYGLRAYEDALKFFGIVGGTPFIEARRKIGIVAQAVRRGDLTGLRR